jgi:hypothetical protein
MSPQSDGYNHENISLPSAAQERPRIERVPEAPYPELPTVLRELATCVQKELGENLIGIYLVGSLATGDFDSDSDVDFLVVIRNELTETAVKALETMHARIYDRGCYPARHLEGSYIRQDLLNDAKAVGVETLWYLDNGSTKMERSIHDNMWHVRWVLRERGIALIGPEPRTLLDPIPEGAMRNEVAGMMRYMADLFAEAINGPLTYWTSRFGQSFAVLTCCRMLHTIHSCTVQSKFAGTKWALDTLDPAWHGLIREAWKEREGVRYCIKIRQHADTDLLKQTMEFIRYSIDTIELHHGSSIHHIQG